LREVTIFRKHASEASYQIGASVPRFYRCENNSSPNIRATGNIPITMIPTLYSHSFMLL
jgi:hypothetical protein